MTLFSENSQMKLITVDNIMTANIYNAFIDIRERQMSCLSHIIGRIKVLR